MHKDHVQPIVDRQTNSIAQSLHDLIALYAFRKSYLGLIACPRTKNTRSLNRRGYHNKAYPIPRRNPLGLAAKTPKDLEFVSSWPDNLLFEHAQSIVQVSIYVKPLLIRQPL